MFDGGPQVITYTPADLGLDVAKIDEDMAHCRGLPLHTYSDPKVYDFELSAIFERKWQFLCPVHKVASPGDLCTGTVGRSQVVVTRAQDGSLNGFLNVCRHRGFKLVEENALGKKLMRCRYHSWAYDLNGKLVAAPNTDDEQGFEKCDHGLVRLAVEQWGPLVFVNLDPDARPLREEHPQLEGWVARAGMKTDPSAYELYREECLNQESNWKLWYDNGTECYHCPTIHSESFGQAFDVRDGSYEYALEGQMTAYAFRSTDQLVDGELRSLTYGSYQVFPGLQLIQQDDLMVIGSMTPTGPESCEFRTYYLMEAGADKTRVDQWIKIWSQTYAEDGEVAEIQQKNIKAPRAAIFRYVSKTEEPTIFINRLIWKSYKEALGLVPA